MQFCYINYRLLLSPNKNEAAAQCYQDLIHFDIQSLLNAHSQNRTRILTLHIRLFYEIEKLKLLMFCKRCSCENHHLVMTPRS